MKPASNRGEKRHLFNKKNGENWIGCFDLARSGEEGVTRPGAIFLDAVPNFERRRWCICVYREVVNFFRRKLSTLKVDFLVLGEKAKLFQEKENAIISLICVTNLLTVTKQTRLMVHNSFGHFLLSIFCGNDYFVTWRKYRALFSSWAATRQFHWFDGNNEFWMNCQFFFISAVTTWTKKGKRPRSSWWISRKNGCPTTRRRGAILGRSTRR